MLAPTRNHVAALNTAARTARLDGHRPGRTVDLADGNQTSAGDTVITRRNNRTLTSGDTQDLDKLFRPIPTVRPNWRLLG